MTNKMNEGQLNELNDDDHRRQQAYPPQQQHRLVSWFSFATLLLILLMPTELPYSSWNCELSKTDNANPMELKILSDQYGCLMSEEPARARYNCKPVYPDKPSINHEPKCLLRPAGGYLQRGHSGVILASANYFESLGQITQAMNEFVDKLLEKISFLAEIIIESSLVEECDNIVCKQAKPLVIGTNSTPASREAYGQDVDLAQMLAKKKSVFDEQEFTNVNQFISSFNDATSAQHQTGCKLFSLDIDRRDLPVNEMEACCKAFGNCYNNCGSFKLDCDANFRSCLYSMCKLNFDFTNETTIKRHHELIKRHALLTAEQEPLIEEHDEGDLSEAIPRDSVDKVELDVDQMDEDELYASLKDNDNSGNNMKRSLDHLEFKYSRATIKSLRDRYKACKLGSKLLIIGNLAFGCQTYKQAQLRACCQTVGTKQPVGGEGDNNGSPGAPSPGAGPNGTG